jgi:hypothetical protein
VLICPESHRIETSVSSGTPEPPDHDPKDWQSPYGSHGGQEAYGDRPPADDPPERTKRYDLQEPGPGASYDRQPGFQPPYEQYGTPAQQSYDQPYGAPAQGPYDPQYGAPAQNPYEQPYGAAGQGPYDQPYGAPGQPSYDQPYGAPAQAPYDQQAYGQPGYNQPYGYSPYQQNPYGYPPRPANDGTRTHAIVALVISIVFGLTCYVTLGGIAGAILSGIALGKVETEPDKARSLLKWAWISIGTNIGLIVVGIVAGILFSVMR